MHIAKNHVLVAVSDCGNFAIGCVVTSKSDAADVVSHYYAHVTPYSHFWLVYIHTRDLLCNSLYLKEEVCVRNWKRELYAWVCSNTWLPHFLSEVGKSGELFEWGVKVTGRRLVYEASLLMFGKRGINRQCGCHWWGEAILQQKPLPELCCCPKMQKVQHPPQKLPLICCGICNESSCHYCRSPQTGPSTGGEIVFSHMFHTRIMCVLLCMDEPPCHRCHHMCCITEFCVCSKIAHCTKWIRCN